MVTKYLTFYKAPFAHPEHMDRCLCWDDTLKGWRCYVYDHISRCWCTQETTEHDPYGKKYIVGFMELRITWWASIKF